MQQPTLHPQTIGFLQQLAANNNRPWFNDHKDQWLEIKAEFDTFVQYLIDQMQQVDPTLTGLTAKNSVYRIYRDTRFSADKTPYKTHIACFLSSWGPKNSGVPGYYVQIGCDNAYGLEGMCDLGGGIFMPSPQALAAIRQEIFYCPDEFLAIINDKTYRHYFGDTFFTSKKLQRVPQGYPADWPHADLLKYKDYCSNHTLDESLVGSPEMADAVLDVWRASLPLNKFLQRAMEEVK
ncbi:MAG: DUF2461 domain-containing protein [Bacteroidales bacterium]|nr:DUF2461 domain-containing protein [Bacteroidales bacterium]